MELKKFKSSNLDFFKKRIKFRGILTFLYVGKIY